MCRDYNGVLDLGSICCRIFKWCSYSFIEKRIKGDEGEVSVLSGGSFEGASDGKLEGVGTGEGDTIGVL